jgi:hypothetical protein
MQLPFDIVVATRNRPQALRLSIPLQLGQSRKPRKLIVADSSDNHEEVCRTVAEVSRGFETPVECIKTSRGLTLQRNVGLRRVEAPVVFFPDDDALWLPGVAESIMRIYERDTAGDVGGVCAAETTEPPEGVIKAAKEAYRQTLKERLNKVLGNQRSEIENALFPNPFHLHGRSRWSVRPKPPWLEEENAVLVEWMTGFRMTFRTDAIRSYSFDETLTGYAVFEDVDASFKILKNQLVVGARNARVFHYKAPSGRGDGRRLGAMQILMRNYVVCKHSTVGSLARSKLAPYARFKFAQYLLTPHTSFGRARIRGAWQALHWTDRFLQALPDELPALYTQSMTSCAGSP